MATTIDKYNSVIKTLGIPLPNWVQDEDDQVRVGAYDGYTSMYRNVPTTFQVVMRGAEDRPLYIPSAKRVVEAVNRYLAKGWKWTVASASDNPADQLTVQVALQKLMTREAMEAKFLSYKRNMLLKGDAFWHVMADLSKPAGDRISVKELDPRSCFRIANAVDNDVTDGWYIVTLYWVDQNTQIAQRLEYRKQQVAPGSPVTIFSQLTFWETNAWDDRFIGHQPLKPVAVPEVYSTDANLAPLLAGQTLPPSITALPVYHTRNVDFGTEPFGISQIAGIETLIAALNQTASDEDISIALQGLGVFCTDSAPPKDSEGNETDWFISPGVVLEMKKESKFWRIEGISSVTPMQDHISFLRDAMDNSSGLSAVAVGKVDVAVAQSGIALRLEMAPVLAQNEEKEIELRSVLDVMTHDLVFMWLPLDGTKPAEDITVTNTFSDPIPVDRAATVKEITDLVTAQLMSKAFAIAYLQRTLGYQFPETMLDDIGTEVDFVAQRLANIDDPGAGATPDGSTGGTAATTVTPPPPGGQPAGASPQSQTAGVAG